MWQDWVNLFLGLFLIPVGVRLHHLHLAVRDITVLVLAIAVLILAGMVSDKRWPEIVNVVIASYLIVLNFFNVPLNFYQYSVFLGGLTVAIFATGAALMEPMPESNHGHEH